VIASLGGAALTEDEKRAIVKAVASALQGQADWLGSEALSLEASNWVARIVQFQGWQHGG
jgi:hypothetical protein